MMRLLRQNLGLKLLSLAAAFLLWLAFSGSRELTTAVSVPVQYRNIPSNLEIGTNIVEQVHLVVRGPSPLLGRLSASHSPVILDLGEIRRPGVRTFSVSRSNVSLPAGVVLERAIPSQIQVRAEERVARDVPVLPVLENVPDGVRVAAWEVTPRTLKVVGPRSRVDAIESVHTDPVDVRAAAGQEEVRTTAFAGDPQVHFTSSPSVILKLTLAPAPREPQRRENKR